MSFSVSNSSAAAFRSEGFVHLPRVFSSQVVDSVLREIQTLGLTNEDFDRRFNSSNLPESIRELHGALSPAVDGLLGRPCAEEYETQVSIFHTGSGGLGGPRSWHMDGFGYLSRGGGWQHLPGFHMLVGVYLTDLSVPRRGNFLLTPGGHERIAQWMREEGKAYFNAAGEVPDSDGLLAAFKAMPMPELQPVLATPGDVLIAHSMLPHSVDVNEGPDRPVVYFRFGFPVKRGYSVLSSPWADWE